ncbi:MAG: hypothetical protein LUC45_06945 [Paraprevotella sp.]|nr:hypothetical protein [Paraprevotella sp.]
MMNHIKHGEMGSICLGLLLCLLAVFLRPTVIRAQNGITVYSDTVSALEDTPDDSVWDHSGNSAASPSTPLPDDWEDNGFFDFMSHVLGLTGFVLILVAIGIFLFPLIAIGVIIYLIYRLNQEKRRNEEGGRSTARPQAMDEATQVMQLKQLPIRRACWGVGLIVVERIADITFLLYLVGVVLLCMAAGNLLTALTHKKQD